MTKITIDREVAEQAIEALHGAYVALRDAINAYHPQPKYVYEHGSPNKFYAQATMMSNDRMQIDPISGNVSINAPQPQPNMLRFIERQVGVKLDGTRVDSKTVRVLQQFIPYRLGKDSVELVQGDWVDVPLVKYE